MKVKLKDFLLFKLKEFFYISTPREIFFFSTVMISYGSFAFLM